VKLKSLAVITLLFVLGCSFASAQSFGFASVGGGQYCDYEQLVNNGDDVYSGIDNFSPCGFYFYDDLNGALSGFTASLPSAGLPVHGAGVDYGDTAYVAEYVDLYDILVNDIWTVHTALKCNKEKDGQFKGNYSWIGVAGSSFGFYFGDNYGFLTCTLPSKGNKNVVAHGPANGKPSKNIAKNGHKISLQ
jgi:hypothetical protein